MAPKDTTSLLGCKIEVIGDKVICIKGSSIMESIDVKAKSRDELLEWRNALESAKTFSTKTVEEHIFEAKKIYSEMNEVIQKHVDELQRLDVAVEDSRLGTALQVFRTHCFIACGRFTLRPI
jgi:hypothetical protein